jgi:hypothetical protein
MKLYRVQKVTPAGELIEESEVEATSPEEAASALVPSKLYRGTRGVRATLRAKVYSLDGANSLIRLYEHDED